MIIDMILDRKENGFWTDEEIDNLVDEARLFGMSRLERAFTDGDDTERKAALCEYIDQNGYNTEIKDFVNAATWLDICNEIDRMAFDDCICELSSVDFITVYDKNDNKLGIIQGTDPIEDWCRICAGHNPIAEEWEDGGGNDN